MIELNAEKLRVKIFDTREEMGEYAACEAEAYLNGLLKTKKELNCVFAAAPSQNDILASLVKKDICWEKINAYHMDEYVGLKKEDPESFGRYLSDHIFSLVPFKSVNYIAADSSWSAEKICSEYCKKLTGVEIDAVFMGIGENGHIAFNDPQVADFNDSQIAKIVELDDICRMQQVHDGCFPTFDDVPKQAITLTVPTMMSAGRLFNVVPTRFKAEAVKETIYGKISEACPATICRTHPDATLYLDRDSAELILK